MRNIFKSFFLSLVYSFLSLSVAIADEPAPYYEEGFDWYLPIIALLALSLLVFLYFRRKAKK